MTTPTWLRSLAEASSNVANPPKVPYHKAKKFFAVDDSGSTIGYVMKAQKSIVFGLHTNEEDMVTKWDTVCALPERLDAVALNYFDGRGGTSPDCIMDNQAAVEEIGASELWVLLTDGEIASDDVSRLTHLAERHGVIQVPVILVITGRRRGSPASANISVGISFFASARDALILFREDTTCSPFSGQTFLIDAKGVFSTLKPAEGVDLSNWDRLPAFDTEIEFNKRCGELAIEFERHDERQVFETGILLGPKWEAATQALVDVSALLAQQQIRHVDLRNLLAEEALTQLALVCKTRDQLGDLRNLIIKHRQREILVRPEDCHGASSIMEQMQLTDISLKEKSRLTRQLRDAHIANRLAYEATKNHPSDEARSAAEINKMINRGLAILSGVEKSSYTAEILGRKSNRAMRAEIISKVDAEIHISKMDLSDNVESLRGTCSICCGEKQIMSVVLKKLDTAEENTTDFALNFPLAAAQAKQNADIISSQCVCFQCALLCPRSIYQEDIVAVIPTIDYLGVNKRYMNHQLALALTAGLKTGASGIVQLFMTVLDRTLETKDWCSKDHEEDTEVLSRRGVLGWTLQNLLTRCRCRENFSETGVCVSYPEALLWAMRDYETLGLDSWAIQYPIAGFSQLLRWYEIVDIVPEESIESMKMAKLFNLTITTIMSGLLHHKENDALWTQPFLELIYNIFHVPGIPQDLGHASIVSAHDFWPKLETALGPWADLKRFLSTFGLVTREKMVSRLQILTFWALYTQKGHATPKYFFTSIRSREPLAVAVLNPSASIPQSVIHDILISIFCPVRDSDSIQAAHYSEQLPPFVSPYGPSVLHCGKSKCGYKFHNDEDVAKGLETLALIIRANRAEHFKTVYGVRSALSNDTGLPEPTTAPKAPVSYHNTLHISTARVWSNLSHERRQSIAEGVARAANGAVEEFARDVKREICARSRRGNIYATGIEEEVKSILPSLLNVLRIASEKLGLSDRTGLRYCYDWRGNIMTAKVEWELMLGSSSAA